MIRWSRVLVGIGLVAVAYGPLANAQERAPSGLSGIVTDGTHPLAGATVEILGVKLKQLTPESGSFRFDGLKPGRYWVRVTRIGHVPAAVTVTLEPGLTREVVVTLEAAPYRLSDLEVAGGMTSHRHWDFAWRSRTSWGRFLTRDDIARANAFDLIDLVQRHLPGRSRWALEQTAWWTPGLARFGYSGFGSALNRDCTPGISINGSRPWPGSSLRDYSLEEIEAVEVYRRGTHAPIDFEQAAGCGLVVLWLR